MGESIKMNSPVKAPYYSLFRLISELKQSCDQTKEDLNTTSKQLEGVIKLIESIDKALIQKYNYEFKDEVTKVD